MTFLESSSRSILLLEHDLFRKPAPTFRDHAISRPSPGRYRILEATPGIAGNRAPFPLTLERPLRRPFFLSGRRFSSIAAAVDVLPSCLGRLQAAGMKIATFNINNITRRLP